MRTKFFDEKGILNVDEVVASRQSFQNIMRDGVITEEEMAGQGKLVLDLFHKMESTLTEAQADVVRDLLAESCVMQSLFLQYELQNLKNYGRF